VTAVIGAGWGIALVVLLIVRGSLPAADRWWVWVCVTGFALGIFGFCYVPVLKRSRARSARRHAARPDARDPSVGQDPPVGQDVVAAEDPVSSQDP